MILVGTTMAPYKADDLAGVTSWIENALELSEDANANGHQLKWFVALELDGRGMKPYAALLALLANLPHEVWTFELNTGALKISSDERLSRICTGRNLVTEYAMRQKDADWLFYCDSDLCPDEKTFTKLLDVNWPVVGGDVPGYCLSGPDVKTRRSWTMGDDGRILWQDEPDAVPPFPYIVQEHWNTAGYLLVHRSVYQQIRWRHNPGTNLTDDPAWAESVLRTIGIKTLVRKDCPGRHDGLVGVELRGHDLTIH